MRLCDHITCDAAAAVHLNGRDYCGPHVREVQWTSRSGHPQAAAVVPPSSGEVPSSTGRASVVASVTASEPLSPSELEDILEWERDYWWTP